MRKLSIDWIFKAQYTPTIEGDRPATPDPFEDDDIEDDFLKVVLDLKCLLHISTHVQILRFTRRDLLRDEGYLDGFSTGSKFNLNFPVIRVTY